MLGHTDVFALGVGVGTVTGVVAGIAVGNIAAGASGLVVCGTLAQRAAQVYTVADTALGTANAAVNIATTGSIGVGDALALAPAVGFGLGQLSGRTYCFTRISISVPPPTTWPMRQCATPRCRAAGSTPATCASATRCC